MRRILATSLIVLLVGVLFPLLALGLDRSGDRIEVSPSQSFVRKTYPALVGVWPRAAAARSVARCKQVTYCDAVPLVLKSPKGVLFQVGITLTWLGPDKKNEKGEVIKDSQGRTQKENNLDIFLWEEIQITTIYKPGYESQCLSKGQRDVPARDCKETVFRVVDSSPAVRNVDITYVWHPEFLKMGDAPSSGEVRQLSLEDPGTEEQRFEKTVNYWIVPYNFEGTNQGYTLTVEFVIQTPEEREAGIEPKFVFPYQTSGSLSRSSSAPTPKATLPSVKLPGADGPVSEHDVVPLKGKFARSAGGLGASGIVLIVGLLLAAGLGTFFVVRRRRQAEAKP